jgi:regulator of replication initiation timing
VNAKSIALLKQVYSSAVKELNDLSMQVTVLRKLLGDAAPTPTVKVGKKKVAAKKNGGAKWTAARRKAQANRMKKMWENGHFKKGQTK